MIIRTPQPIDLTEQRVQVGDTVAFVEKFTATQQKLEDWTAQDWNNFVADVGTVAGELETARDQSVTAKNQSIEAAGLSAGARDQSVTAKNQSVEAAGLSAGARDQSVTAKNQSAEAAGLSAGARDQSVTAKNQSVEAAGLSAGARDESVTARNQAVIAKEAAEAAAQQALASSFAPGTKMLFQQTNAPTGWVKDTTHNNKALRVVTGTAGSGGSNAFSTAFNSARTTSSNGAHSHTVTVNNHTLTVAQMPSHRHRSGLRVKSDHSNDMQAYANEGFFDGSNVGGVAAYSSSSASTARRAHTSEAGSSDAHNHGASSNSTGAHTHTLNLNVQYVDLIIATKQ